MSTFRNKTVLITGGASGIGKIMALKSLERGAKVIIWDINSESIEQTQQEFAHLGTIAGYKVDVSKVEEVKQAASQVQSQHNSVDILINNAGIVVGKYFHEHTDADITRTMDINANAPMHITLAFLQEMMHRNSGHICNIASSAGLVSNPKMSVYAASKWSVVGWSDSLRLEMEQLQKNIKVTTIMPYYINTGMFDGVQSILPILKPEAAAHTIIQSIEKDRRMVTLPGYIYRLTRISQGIMPISFFDWFVGGVLGVYKTMADFKGRK